MSSSIRHIRGPAPKSRNQSDPDFGILGQHDRKPVEYEFDFFG